MNTMDSKTECFVVKIINKGEYLFEDKPLITDNNYYIALKYNKHIKLPNNTISRLLINEDVVENKLYIIK
jgi:hypothetical protein